MNLSSPPGKWELFRGFLEIGMTGFGGVGTVAYHIIVTKRRWLSPQDYMDLLALGQILPGGNVLNVSILVGDRFAGVWGAVIALTALMVSPLLFLSLGLFAYHSFAHLPFVQILTLSLGTAAAGQAMGLALKMMRHMLSPSYRRFGLVGLTFLVIAILRISLFYALLCLIPLSFLLSQKWDKD